MIYLRVIIRIEFFPLHKTAVIVQGILTFVIVAVSRIRTSIVAWTLACTDNCIVALRNGCMNRLYYCYCTSCAYVAAVSGLGCYSCCTIALRCYHTAAADSGNVGIAAGPSQGLVVSIAWSDCRCQCLGSVEGGESQRGLTERYTGNKNGSSHCNGACRTLIAAVSGCGCYSCCTIALGSNDSIVIHSSNISIAAGPSQCFVGSIARSNGSCERLRCIKCGEGQRCFIKRYIGNIDWQGVELNNFCEFSPNTMTSVSTTCIRRHK